MTVEKTVRIKLTDEELQTLIKANNIINEIYNNTSDYSCEIDFEDNVEDVLDEMQSNIRYII